MEQLSINGLFSLLKVREQPCISVYIGGDSKTALTNQLLVNRNRLLEQAQEELSKHIPAEQMNLTMQPLRDIEPIKVAMRYGASVCLFRSSTRAGYFVLPERVENKVVIANSFHFKPIVDCVNPINTWLLVSVTGSQANIFRGRGNILNLTKSISLTPRGAKDPALLAKKIGRWIHSLGISHEAPCFFSGPTEFGVALGLRIANRPCITLPPLPDVYLNREISLLEAVLPYVKDWTHHLKLRSLSLLKSAFQQGLAFQNVHEISTLASCGEIKLLAICKQGYLPSKIVTLRDGFPADCPLDDLAQQCLLSGAYVFTLDDQFLPSGIHALALSNRALRAIKKPGVSAIGQSLTNSLRQYDYSNATKPSLNWDKKGIALSV